MKTMLGWYSGPLAFEIPSRLIEILPNVKLKLAVLKDPEITADKERLWEASGERGCNELHVKSFPLQMRELPGRGGAVPVARGAWVHRRPPLIVLVWIKAALQNTSETCAPGPPRRDVINNKHWKSLKEMFSNLCWQIHVQALIYCGQ